MRREIEGRIGVTQLGHARDELVTGLRALGAEGRNRLPLRLALVPGTLEPVAELARADEGRVRVALGQHAPVARRPVPAVVIPPAATSEFFPELDADYALRAEIDAVGRY